MEKQQKSIYLDKDVIRALEKYSEEERRTVSDTVNYIVSLFFKEKNK